MKKNNLWILLFIVFMGLGYLHGVQPEAGYTNFRGTPEKLQILTTDEVFFPDSVRKILEEKLNVTLSVMLTRDWESIQARSIENSGVDLVFLPSHWAYSLAQQGFLSPFHSTLDAELFTPIATDYVSLRNQAELSFLPLYWVKTGIQTSKNKLFTDFLKDQSKQEQTLFLLSDEDLLLKHFQLWKTQGLWPQVAQKKILTMSLDQLARWESRVGAFERSLDASFKGDNQGNLSALLIWGAGIPEGSNKKTTAKKLLKYLMDPGLQSELIKKSPFNTTLATVNDNSIPFHRRAGFIRDLKLKDSIILEAKDAEARQKLRQNFNFFY